MTANPRSPDAPQNIKGAVTSAGNAQQAARTADAATDCYSVGLKPTPSGERMRVIFVLLITALLASTLLVVGALVAA